MNAALLLAFIGFPAAAQARDLWRGEAGAVVEVQGFYKHLLNVSRPEPALVRGTQSLKALLDEVKASLSPEQQASMPEFVTLPSMIVTDVHLARLAATARASPWLKVDVAWQLAALAGDFTATSAGPGLGATMFATAPVGSQRRLVDFDSALVAQTGFRAEHNIDRLALTLALPFGDVTLGRQVLAWGTGRFWNPTDVLSPFPPTAVDREVRRGFDAARLSLALGTTTQLDLLYFPRTTPSEMGAVARLQGNLWNWDASFSLAKYVHDVVVGADVVGDVGPLSVHAEAAYTIEVLGWGVSNASLSLGEHFLRGVVGFDWRPAAKLVLSAEYGYNGAGAATPAGYVATLTSARARRGEVFGAGRHASALAVMYQVDELLSVQALALVNWLDPSAMIVPSVEYSPAQDVIIRLGASLPIGARPEPAVFERLTPTDVLTQSPALGVAKDTLGLRSEYGSSGWAAFFQVGVYLP
jgi:hypothetical protein